jgi:hypothetical protein
LANPVCAELPPKIKNYLNQGDRVAAEIRTDTPGVRCFVSVVPRANLDVPREETRYLNSRYSMWEYWHYEICRMVLRPGWEADVWNCDLYRLEDETVHTRTESAFYAALAKWVDDLAVFKHHFDSECPP